MFFQKDYAVDIPKGSRFFTSLAKLAESNLMLQHPQAATPNTASWRQFKGSCVPWKAGSGKPVMVVDVFAMPKWNLNAMHLRLATMDSFLCFDST